MTTDHAPHHRSPDDLLVGLDHVRRSPRDEGTVEMIVARPRVDARVELESAMFDLDLGLVGDTWIERGSSRTPDGGPNPEAQVTVMNTRFVDLVAGGRDRWAFAGDQVFVDLDLGVENLPPGTELHLGEARLEVTAAPHTGCAKFSERFGVEALRLTATPDGRSLRLRGINTKVLLGGEVRRGDTVRVVRP